MANQTNQQSATIGHYSAPPPCLVCGSRLRLDVARSAKSGKPFVMLRCPREVRHFRAFINDKGFVEYVIEQIEGKVGEHPSEVFIESPAKTDNGGNG
jgi:hypothetical protein